MDNIIEFYSHYLRYFRAKDSRSATLYDKYMALSYAVRSHMVDKWINTQKRYYTENKRRIYFLSMEYVFGKSLKQNLINLGIEESASKAVEKFGSTLTEIYQQEDDFELGNAGKGRLAASLLEALASNGIPAMGYGLRYDYALFKQNLKNGMQTEKPYDWLHKGHPWEVKRPEYSTAVGFHGRVDGSTNYGKHHLWTPADVVNAVPYDFPVSGYHTDDVNTLRLWFAEASEDFLEDYLNHGDYVRACEEKFQSGRVTKYLFPDENIRRATEMSIKQQFFFASASLQDILRRYKLSNNNIEHLHQKIIIQLNGSRCAIAIAELMRLLIDNERLSWNKSWEIVRNVFSYTSHAVVYENLEKWPLYLLEKIMPRHAQIIYEINQQHLDSFRSQNLSNSVIRDLSLIEEGEVKWVRMAQLGIIGTTSVNGVSVAQSKILKTKIFAPFAKNCHINFKSITNGIAYRRWLLCANKPLSTLITSAIGDGWIKSPKALLELMDFEHDEEFADRLFKIKHSAKDRLCSCISYTHSLTVDPNTFFDVHCKKVNTYKRQMLHILYIIETYLTIKEGNIPQLKRTHIFGGRAAPGDFLAKQVIHFINIIADILDNDEASNDSIKVIYIPNYGVSAAECIVPAADLSEQIAAPMFEASGTSNMKFAANGALTIASKSGSNIELIKTVGAENIFVLERNGDDINNVDGYNAGEYLENSPRLKKIFAFIDKILYDYPHSDLVYPLLSSLKDQDPYRIMVDYNDYCFKQKMVEERYSKKYVWLKSVIHNIAKVGWFSSDRVVNEYAKEIWKIEK